MSNGLTFSKSKPSDHTGSTSDVPAKRMKMDENVEKSSGEQSDSEMSENSEQDNVEPNLRLFQEIREKLESLTENVESNVNTKRDLEAFGKDLKSFISQENNRIASDLLKFVETKMETENAKQIKCFQDLYEKEKETTQLYQILLNSKDEIIKLKDQLFNNEQKLATQEMALVKSENRRQEDIHTTEDLKN